MATHEEEDSFPNEQSPLLQNNASDQGNPAVLLPTGKDIQTRVFVLILGLIVTTMLAIQLQDPPRTRLYESIYCRGFYGEHDPSRIDQGGNVEEQFCKIEPVQRQVALLKGWLSFFDYLPGIFVAVPIGILADEYGRKWLTVVSMLSTLGRAVWIYIVCAFPGALSIRLIWLETILNVFGGGTMVTIAQLYVMIADVTPKTETATTFFRLQAAMFACMVVAPPISAVTMERDPWIAMSLAIYLQALSIPIALALPETLGVQRDDDLGSTPTNSNEENSDSVSLSATFSSGKGSPLSRMQSSLSSLLSDSAFLFHDWRIVFFMFLLSMIMAINGLDSVLLQYISQRYNWTLARSTYIYSLQACIAIIGLLILIPLLSTYLLEKMSFSASRKNLLISRISLALLAFGSILQGVAPNISVLFAGLTICILGTGVGASTRALITSYVMQDEVARLYSAIATAETVGMMASGPLVASLFSIGLGRGGGIWLGLPFVVVGVVLGFAAVGMCMLRFERNKEGEHRREEDGPPNDLVGTWEEDIRVGGLINGLLRVEDVLDVHRS